MKYTLESIRAVSPRFNPESFDKIPSDQELKMALDLNAIAFDDYPDADLKIPPPLSCR